LRSQNIRRSVNDLTTTDGNKMSHRMKSGTAGLEGDDETAS